MKKELSFKTSNNEIAIKLFQNIKNELFRSNIKTDLRLLDNYLKSKKSKKSKLVKFLFENNIHNETLLMAKDLENIEKDVFMLTEPLSKLGKDMKKELKEDSQKVKDFLMASASDINLEVMEILRTSKNSSVVGGAVRDAFNMIEPKDYDYVTDLSYDELTELFLSKGFSVKETGKEFLIFNCSKKGENFEIATFRSDGRGDGRRPDKVEVSDIFQDAKRRDFTVGAGYFNLTTNLLVDPNGNTLEDLRQNTLRFVGKPQDRIREDYIRVFRFYRFIGRGFKPNKRCLSAVRELYEEAHNKSNPQRIRLELEKMVL